MGVDLPEGADLVPRVSTQRSRLWGSGVVGRGGGLVGEC